MKRDPLDAVVGAIAGLLFGITSGLILCLYVVSAQPGIFLVAVLVCSALVCSAMGYWKGNDFFRWLRDHWFDW
jgi:membrane protein YqaA with SNARE-associated domain